MMLKAVQVRLGCVILVKASADCVVVQYADVIDCKAHSSDNAVRPALAASPGEGSAGLSSDSDRCGHEYLGHHDWETSHCLAFQDVRMH